MAQYGTGVNENAELTNCVVGRGKWRNFTGERSEFNKEGEYSFTVFLSKELYEDLKEMGWHVKHKDYDDEREYQLDVAFTYDRYPPSITMISEDGATAILNKDTVDLLQTASFDRCDIIIRPYNWERNGNSGVKAYLQEMTVWIKKPRRTFNAELKHSDDDDLPFNDYE